jgi:3',5'-nucleoside bisphosphate phosphatase
MARIDLHSHSTASDGRLSPAQLVALAWQAGIEVLALTDHDTTGGLEEAACAAVQYGLRLIPGVEISVTWNASVVHILGLNIDPADAPLQRGLAELRVRREQRAEEIARRLGEAGIGGAWEAARSYASGANISRAHFARFLVDAGHARNVQAVFKRFLVRGKPGYVPAQWASLEQAVAWITDAGGQAVIAHPARYRLRAPQLVALLEEFRHYGGCGIEVISASHTAADSALIATLARRVGLLAAAGSDYHGPEHGHAELGRLAPLPQGCTPIWETWNLP